MQISVHYFINALSTWNSTATLVDAPINDGKKSMDASTTKWSKLEMWALIKFLQVQGNSQRKKKPNSL